MPTATDDWFLDWVDRHCARFPRGDWPPLDSEFWKALRHMFVTKGVTEAVADEASVLLFENPPSFPDEHPKALLEKVRQVWHKSRVPSIAAADSFGAAENAAWDRAADAHWEQLPEEDRAEALAMARERAGPWAGHPRCLLKLAKGWAYDPSTVIGLPPKVEDEPGPGPKRVFTG